MRRYLLYQQENFWKAMHEGFARLQADPKAWHEYREEAALWDSAVADGLEDEEPYFTGEDAAATTPG